MQDDIEGDKTTYILREPQFLKPESRQTILFETFYYDDWLRIELYQKNSLIKSNLIGKGWIELKSVAYGEDIVLAAPI